MDVQGLPRRVEAEYIFALKFHDGPNKKIGVRRRRFRAPLELGGEAVSGATINLLGLTFKENVTDL